MVSEDDNIRLLQAFKDAGVWPQNLQPETQTLQSLAGLSFVVTGTLPTMSRNEADA